METGIGTYDIVVLIVVYFASALTGLAKTVSDRKYRDAWDLLSVACVTGFSAVMVVGLLHRNTGSLVGYELWYISVAVATGFLGERATSLCYLIWDTILSKFGVDLERFKDYEDFETDNSSGGSDYNGVDSPELPASISPESSGD